MSKQDDKTCPATGCTKTHPANLLMCQEHWRLVPTSTQQAVYRAYGSFRKHTTADAARKLEATQRLAIDGVNALLEARA